MARLSVEEAEKLGGGEGEFFTLKNDKDAARVRLLYSNQDELDIYAVHEVEFNGKKRWIECLQTPNCPGCAVDGYPLVRVFIKLLDTRDGKYKVWERGKKFIPKLTGFLSKYGPLVNRPYEIERHGKAGDTQTTYEMYALDKDDKTLADFEEQDELLGGLILVKGYDEFKVIMENQPPETDDGYGYNNTNYNNYNNNSHNGSNGNFNAPVERQRDGKRMF